MREVYCNPDSARVGYYKSVLDEAGILNLIRNDNVVEYGGSAGGECLPALCVVRDEDYEEAMKILGAIHYAAPSNLSAWRCAKCNEEVPGNFDSCWNCGGERETQPA